MEIEKGCKYVLDLIMAQFLHSLEVSVVLQSVTENKRDTDLTISVKKKIYLQTCFSFLCINGMGEH